MKIDPMKNRCALLNQASFSRWLDTPIPKKTRGLLHDPGPEGLGLAHPLHEPAVQLKEYIPAPLTLNSSRSGVFKL